MHNHNNSTSNNFGSTGGQSSGTTMGGTGNSGTTMDDKSIMESLLNSTKGVCDLYLHGTIESATPDVHSAFDCALNESLTMQSDIFSKMSGKGWYPSQQAQEQQVQQVKTKFSSTMQG